MVLFLCQLSNKKKVGEKIEEQIKTNGEEKKIKTNREEKEHQHQKKTYKIYVKYNVK